MGYSTGSLRNVTTASPMRLVYNNQIRFNDSIKKTINRQINFYRNKNAGQ
jgi:hypothetical protein